MEEVVAEVVLAAGGTRSVAGVDSAAVGEVWGAA